MTAPSNRCVNSVADLRALSAGAFPCVQLLGYYAPGDGGGGEFYWDASSIEADNGGTIIIPASNPAVGRWKRLVERPLSVKWFGAKGDGIANDARAIQVALDAAGDAGGGTVILPAGTYLIGTTLSIHSNVSLRGAGIEATTLRDHPKLGANRLIFLQGTPTSRIRNACLARMTLRNGTATAGPYTVGKDALRAEYVDGLLVEESLFTEVEGVACCVVKYAWNVTVRRCRFYRWTYGGMLVLPESKNIRCEDNIFDTAVSKAYPNLYCFATGGERLNEGAYFVENVWVERNVFLNNPIWEGIDTHGAENIWIRENFIENCHYGISAGIAHGFVSNPVLKNVYIENNRIIQGDGINDGCGVLVAGRSAASVANNIHIRGNSITGFGELGQSTGTIGAITVYLVQNVHVVENIIDQYAQAAIMLYHSVQDGFVLRNRILDARGAGSLADLVAIYLNSWGLYGITIRENTLAPSSHAAAPASFLRASSPALSAQIADNFIGTLSSPNLFQNPNYLPVEWRSKPTQYLTQKYGDVILTNEGKPGWYVTSPKLGFGSLDSAPIVAATTRAGSVTTKIVGNLNGDYRWLPVGMNVVIAGAGANGADLNARVIANDGINLTLDTSAGTSQSAANVTYQPLTLG